MLGLLLGVAAQLGALGLGCGLGDAGTELGDGGSRVSILAGVARQLLAGQLPSGPALVERMLEDIPLEAGGLDSNPQNLVAHDFSPLRYRQRHQNSDSIRRCALRVPTSPHRSCPQPPAG